MGILAALIMVLTGIASGPVCAAEVRTDLPAKIAAGSKYLFYLHGVSVELNGPDSYNRRFRKKYQTTVIARSLAERGFTVIAETRPKGTRLPATQTSSLHRRDSDQAAISDIVLRIVMK
jgi:hypothetical protein